MTDSPSSRLAAAAARSRPAAAGHGPSPGGARVGGVAAAGHSPAGRRGTTAGAAPTSLAANYPGLHELVEERIFPFMQQVVGFLGIG